MTKGACAPRLRLLTDPQHMHAIARDVRGWCRQLLFAEAWLAFDGLHGLTGHCTSRPQLAF